MKNTRQTYALPWPTLIEDDAGERTVVFLVHYHYWPGSAAVRYGYHGGSPAEPADVDPVHVDVPEGVDPREGAELLRTLRGGGYVAGCWRQAAVEAVEAMGRLSA